MRSRSAIRISGLADAKARARKNDPRLTDAVIAKRVGTSTRTLSRWEAGDFVPLHKALKFEEIYGTTFPEAHADDEAAPVVSRAAPEEGYTAEDCRRIEDIYHRQKALGASDDELSILYDALSNAYRSRLRRSTPDEDELNDLVHTIVEDKLNTGERVRGVVARRKRRS